MYPTVATEAQTSPHMHSLVQQCTYQPSQAEAMQDVQGPWLAYIFSGHRLPRRPSFCSSPLLDNSSGAHFPGSHLHSKRRSTIPANRHSLINSY